MNIPQSNSRLKDQDTIFKLAKKKGGPFIPRNFINENMNNIWNKVPGKVMEMEVLELWKLQLDARWESNGRGRISVMNWMAYSYPCVIMF